MFGSISDRPCCGVGYVVLHRFDGFELDALAASSAATEAVE